MAREVQVTFDCADPVAVSRFWASVLGYQVQPAPPPFATTRSAIVDPDGKGPRVFFQQVPERKSVKNRVHLDVRAAPGLAGEARMAALEQLADELVSAGATRLQRIEGNDVDEGIIVMADPEGNEFCLD